MESPESNGANQEEQKAGILEIILKGGSLVLAAQQMEVAPLEAFEWLDRDPYFAHRYQQALRALDSNVLAKLYQEAMTGTSSAIALWIKERQPVDWKMSTPPNHRQHDNGEPLSDDELVELARQVGLLPPTPQA